MFVKSIRTEKIVLESLPNGTGKCKVHLFGHKPD